MSTQTITNPTLTLRLTGNSQTASTTDRVAQHNIFQKADKLVKMITENSLFSEEQKAFVNSWNEKLFTLLYDANTFNAPNSVCYLYFAIIQPVLFQHIDNILILNEFIPLIKTHRELLSLLLPADLDVEGYIAQREEQFSLLLEMKAKLKSTEESEARKDNEIREQATHLKENILALSQYRESSLQDLAARAEPEIKEVSRKLKKRSQATQDLQENFEARANDMKNLGEALKEANQNILILKKRLEASVQKV